MTAHAISCVRNTYLLAIELSNNPKNMASIKAKEMYIRKIFLRTIPQTATIAGNVVAGPD